MKAALTAVTHLAFDPKDKKHKRMIDVPVRSDNGEIRFQLNPAAVASIEREYGAGVTEKPCLAFPEPPPQQPIIVQSGDNAALTEALKAIKEMREENRELRAKNAKGKKPKEKDK